MPSQSTFTASQHFADRTENVSEDGLRRCGNKTGKSHSDVESGAGHRESSRSKTGTSLGEPVACWDRIDRTRPGRPRSPKLVEEHVRIGWL